MKYKLILKLSIIFISFLSCNSQQSKIKKMPLTEQEILELATQIKAQDTVFMKDGLLNIFKLKKIANIKEKYVAHEGIEKSVLDYKYTHISDNGNSIYIRGNDVKGFTKICKNKQDFFERLYAYFPSGELKFTYRYYIERFHKGFRFDFDQLGNVEKYEDFDAPYDFGWEDVKSFLENRKIATKDIDGIYRSDLTGKYSWQIVYKSEALKATDRMHSIFLDAKTGAVLKEEILDYTVHLD